MTNPFRGELEVNLGSKKYKTRLTVDSCIKLETALNMSLVKLAQRLSEGDLMLSEISVILTSAIKGGGNDVTQDQINKLVYENGLSEGLRCCGEILANVLSGGSANDEETTEKKPEEGEQKMI